jgi:hypothetical protein
MAMASFHGKRSSNNADEGIRQTKSIPIPSSTIDPDAQYKIEFEVQTLQMRELIEQVFPVSDGCDGGFDKRESDMVTDSNSDLSDYVLGFEEDGPSEYVVKLDEHVTSEPDFLPESVEESTQFQLEI